MSFVIDSAPIRIPDIILPNSSINLHTWSTIACDQFTSNSTYWNSVKNIVGDSPSTFHITLPEIYLENEALTTHHLENIQKYMTEYRNHGIFEHHKNCLLLVRRTTKDGHVRSGLMVQVDLAAYNPDTQSASAIRATEAIVPERLIKRIEVRKKTSLDFSHVMMLYEDVDNTLISRISEHVHSCAYDTQLMLDGGHIRADFCDTQESARVLSTYFASMKLRLKKEEKSALFVIGDGNHSLMAAKQAWLDAGANMKHPDRWALVELVNIHDPGLGVFPIHRVLYGASCEALYKILQNFGSVTMREKSDAANTVDGIVMIHKGIEKIWIPHDKSKISIEALEGILEKCNELYEAIDFIHDDAEVRAHASEGMSNTLGIVFPAFERASIFRYVHENRLFPRKSFALGHSIEKRYYIEACDRSVSDRDSV